MAEVELQFGKARFAEDYGCVPVSSEDRMEQSFSPANSGVLTLGASAPAVHPSGLTLINARHPLLERNLKAKGAASRSRDIELEVRSGRRHSSSPAPTPAAKPLA